MMRQSSFRWIGLLFAALLCSEVAAATHTWINAAGGNWSTVANWQGNSPPTAAEAQPVVVVFASNITSNMDIANLAIDTLHFTGSGNTINGATKLGINGANVSINIQDDSGGNTINCPITLLNFTVEAAVTTGTLTLAGNIDDAAAGIGFFVNGAGTIAFTMGNNTYGGLTKVIKGTLTANVGSVAIPNNLQIGNGTLAAGSATVKLLFLLDFGATSQVTVNSDGVLDTNSTSQQISGLTVSGGSVTLGSGALTIRNGNTIAMTGGSITATAGGSISLGGDITATSSATAGATITASIALNANRNITVNSGAVQPELTITGAISDGAASSGIFKAGTGTLSLKTSSGNTFTGTTDLDKGVLLMNATAGTIVPGTLIIGNNVDAANSAILRENVQANDIATTSAVTINASGQLDINNEQDTIGKLTGIGGIQLLPGGTLTVNSDGTSSTFFGTINGSGGSFIKKGAGFLILTGNSPFSGTTTVGAGSLLLSGATTNTVIQGPLVVGAGTGAANSCLLQLLAPSQIADNIGVTVKSDGKFDLNAQNETIGSLIINDGNVTVSSATLTLGSTLTMSGGTITATTGSLSLGGDVTATSSATAGAAITTPVALNATRKITVNPGAKPVDLTISGLLSNGAAASGFTKDGAGNLALSGTAPNTYTGMTTVDKGMMTLTDTVGANIPGNVTIGNAVDPAGSATLQELNSSDIASTSAMNINPSGVFDLNGHSDVLGALSGSGMVKDSGTVSIGNDNSSQTYSGVISGTGTLAKLGIGTQTLTGNNTYTGTTLILNGTLLVNGSQPSSAVTVTTGATLGGTGTVGNTTITASKLSPGVNGPGTLSTGNLQLDANSTILLDLVSAGANGFDSINVTGTVNLGGCALTLNVDPNFTAAAVPMVLINNDAADAITGTFKNFTEGQSVPLNALTATFSYIGGTGNDVSLLVTNVPPMLTSSIVATPSPAGAGQTITFSAPATDANNDTLSFAWNFGDGSTASGASVTHAYPTAGTYTVSVVVSDGFGGTVNGSTMIVVNPPIVGTGPDSDGDGFSDSFETAFGSDPNNSNDSPTGGPATAGIIQPLTVTKASIKLNFAKSNSDAIGFSGTLNIPSGFKLSGAKVAFDISGIAKIFTLDGKGGSKKGGDTFKLSVKSSKGNVSAQTSKFAVVSKGSFAASLAAAGLVGTADVKSKPVTVVITAIFNKTILQKQQNLTFTAKKGKTGAAK